MGPLFDFVTSPEVDYPKGQCPDKTKELHARLVAWRAEIKAPMPAKNNAAGEPKAKGKGKKKKAA